MYVAIHFYTYSVTLQYYICTQDEYHHTLESSVHAHYVYTRASGFNNRGPEMVSVNKNGRVFTGFFHGSCAQSPESTAAIVDRCILLSF